MSQFNPTEENPLLKVSSVAKIFDVKEDTVRGWIESGKIEATKVFGQWRIPKSECVRLANQEYGS